MRTRLLALTCFLVLGLDTASAQEVLAPEPPPADPSSVTSSQEQDRELDAWLSAMTKWQRYDAKWSNRPARDGMGRIVEHRPRQMRLNGCKSTAPRQRRRTYWTFNRV